MAALRQVTVIVIAFSGVGLAAFPFHSPAENLFTVAGRHLLYHHLVRSLSIVFLADSSAQFGIGMYTIAGVVNRFPGPFKLTRFAAIPANRNLAMLV